MAGLYEAQGKDEMAVDVYPGSSTSAPTTSASRVDGVDHRRQEKDQRLR